MADNTSVTGLKGAQAIATMLEILTVSQSGADWVDEPRNDGVTNAQILDWQAEQGRDIRANSEDGEKVARAFLNKFSDELKLVGRLDTNNNPVTLEKAATQGLTAGLRDAAKLYSSILLGRIKGQRDNTGASLKEVGEAYGRRRQAKYFVSPDIALIRTRQLGNTFIKGKIKVRIDKSKIGRLAARIIAKR